jgi:predicted Zn-dependent protease
MKMNKKMLHIMILFMVIAMCIPPQASCITIKEEEDLGAEFMKYVGTHYRLIDDPMIVDYVERVARNILSTMEPQPFPYNFYIVREEVYNAFAGPAGHIFIHSGLIAAMENEDELAGILAHEILHVKARHISQKFERSTKISAAALAGMVAGVLLGAAGAGEAANAVVMSSMAAGQSMSLAYSRQDEMQADELGIQHLTAAGYKGEGLLTMLKKIRDKQWFGKNEIPTYLMTHPAVDDRIAYVDTWVQTHPNAVIGPRLKNDEFRQIRTRIIAAYSDKEFALNEMQTALEKSPDDPVINHGYGIALARNDRPAEAVVYIRKSLIENPLDAFLLKDLGEIYFMAGQYANALTPLEGSLSIRPGDYETLFLLGRTCLEMEKYSRAASAFETLLKLKPDYPPGLHYLGEVCGKQGRMGEAHYYLGRYHKNRGDFNNALFHLSQALKLTDDPQRKQEIDDMLKSIQKDALPPDSVQKPKSK